MDAIDCIVLDGLIDWLTNLQHKRIVVIDFPLHIPLSLITHNLEHFWCSLVEVTVESADLLPVWRSQAEVERVSQGPLVIRPHNGPPCWRVGESESMAELVHQHREHIRAFRGCRHTEHAFK